MPVLEEVSEEEDLEKGAGRGVGLVAQGLVDLASPVHWCTDVHYHHRLAGNNRGGST